MGEQLARREDREEHARRPLEAQYQNGTVCSVFEQFILLAAATKIFRDPAQTLTEPNIGLGRNRPTACSGLTSLIF